MYYLPGGFYLVIGLIVMVNGEKFQVGERKIEMSVIKFMISLVKHPDSSITVRYKKSCLYHTWRETRIHHGRRQHYIENERFLFPPGNQSKLRCNRWDIGNCLTQVSLTICQLSRNGRSFSFSFSC